MNIVNKFKSLSLPAYIALCAVALAVASSMWSYETNAMIAYGDAESHLNIAKRVTHSLTPGLAQLGGIWLPLPHLMMVPLTFFDPLWRSGLAGAVVSGFSYVVSAVWMYKLVYLVFKKTVPAAVGSFIFMLNPNILYMQTTAMTELPLIMFFLLSTYFFVKYMYSPSLPALVAAAFFGFCATLSRYDGWLLVMAEAGILVLIAASSLLQNGRAGWKRLWQRTEGTVILYSTLAFFGIALWVLWDFLILNDPLYFTNSPFSAKSQQKGWSQQNMLPAQDDVWLSFLYYLFTAVGSVGYAVSVLAGVGLAMFLVRSAVRYKFFIALLLFVPFIFYVLTLYMGQSVIFIPELTPDWYKWQLFNVRYGVMMVPVAAFFASYIVSRFFRHRFYIPVSLFVVAILAVELVLFALGKQTVLSYEDGVNGLSSASESHAQEWLTEKYDYGLVLMDDYARTLSVVRSGIPMENTIYIGTKPYWEESLENPEKHARWVILQKDDAVWKSLYEDPAKQAHLYAYFEKVYTSENILIFRRNARYAYK